MNVILSYFHTRIGTSIFYSFPKAQLDKEMSDRLYDIMTQQKEQELFIHSFENIKIINRDNFFVISFSINLTIIIGPKCPF